MRLQLNRKIRMTTVGMAVLAATAGTAVAGQSYPGQSYAGHGYGGQGYGTWTGGPMAGPSMMYPPVSPQPQFRYGPPHAYGGYGMNGHNPYGQSTVQGGVQGDGSTRTQGGANAGAPMGTAGRGRGASMSAGGEMQGDIGGEIGAGSAGAMPSAGGVHGDGGIAADGAQGGAAMSAGGGMHAGGSASGDMAGSTPGGEQRRMPAMRPNAGIPQQVQRQQPLAQRSASQTDVAQRQGGSGQQGDNEPVFGAKVADLKGKRIVNKSGKEIGNLDRIVADRNTGQLLGIVDVGGFLGIGGQTIALPLRGMTIHGDELVFDSDLSKEQIKRQRDYEAPYYTELKGDRIVGR